MNYLIKDAQQLGPLIKAFRKDSGLTQQHVGQKSDLRQNAVSLIESDAGASSVERLFKLLQALDLEVIIRRRGER